MKVAVMEPVLQTFGDFFFEARRLGFAGVELTLTREQLRADDRRRVQNLRGSADASSLAIHSLVLGEHNHGGVASADAHVAAAAAEDVEIAIEWAVTLGAGAVLVPFFLEADLRTEADVDRCADAFGALCPLAASRGVTLCFEGLLAADRIIALAERIDSPGFGCYYDLANPLTRGLDPASEIRLLGSLIRRVHVKDVLVRGGDVHPGLGRVDFRECARALDEIGYDGWLTLETPPAPPPLVARDLSFVRSRFPHVGANAPWPRFGAFSYDFGRGRWHELATTFARLDLVDVVLGRELLDECLEQPGVPERAQAALREHGLAVAALAGYRNPVAPDRSSRRANIEYIRRCLELAPALGTYVVCTETGTRRPGSDWTDSPDNVAAEAWRLLEEALEILVPAAESSGTILALEAHVKNVLRTQDQLFALLERFPSRHLQVVCDPYNYISAGLVADRQRATTELLDRFEHRFVAAHLKDVAAGGAETGTPELGTGVFEQRPYLEFLRLRRPDLSLVLEHLPLENIPIARARVLELAGL